MFRLILLLLCFTALSAQARPVGLVTGPPTGTYIAVGRDIAEIGKAAGLDIEVKESIGSIDNIKRLNSKENAALGIVQADVLNFMDRSDNKKTLEMADSLRLVLPLYREEVHVLANRNIRNFSDLEGKRVVIGREGSGHLLTAINLFAMMGVTPEKLLKTPPPEGVLDLLEGKVDAVIFVAGKPMKLFENLESLEEEHQRKFAPLLNQLHFIPLNDPKMLEDYHAATITPEDYRFVDETVPTLGVTALLVSFDFSKNTRRHRKRCKQIRQLGTALKQNLPQLKKNGHPKWQYVSFDDDIPYWKKGKCSP